MVRKKLLALASVIGLLACGACFLPPPRPQRIHLQGAQSVLVKVTDVFNEHLVDSDEFGRWVAEAINKQEGWQSATARFGQEANAGDVVLHVFLQSERAVSKATTPGHFDWNLTITVYATLTTANGAWAGGTAVRQPGWKGRLPVSSPADAWHDPAVRTWLNGVANQVAADLIHESR